MVFRLFIRAMVKVVAILGMVVFPPLMTESLFHGYINPYGIGLMSLSPIYMEMSWEFRPWHIQCGPPPSYKWSYEAPTSRVVTQVTHLFSAI